MASVLEEYLVKFGFDVDTSKLDNMVKSLKDGKKVLEAIREPFFALNQVVEGLGLLADIVKAPFEAMIGISRESAAAADDLDDMSKQLGVSAKELQEWGYIAQVTGSSAQEMNGALRLLNRDIAQAVNGSKEAADAYAKLGISLHNADGSTKQAGQVMGDILDKLAQMPDEAKRAAAGMEFFGRGGINIRGLFGVGVEELGELRREFELLGGRTPEKLAELGGEQERLAKGLELFKDGLKNWYALGFQPVVNGTLKWLNDLAKKYGPQLRLFFFQIGDTFAKIGAVVGDTVDTIVGALKAIYDNLDILLPLVAAWKYEMLLAAGSTIAAWAAAAAPFVALFLVLEDLFAFLQGKDSVIGVLAERWTAWTDEVRKSHPWLAKVMDVVSAIAEAVKLAAMYVWDLIEAFRDGGLSGLVKELGDTVSTAMNAALGSVKSVFGSLFGGGTTVLPSTGAVSNNSATYNNASANATVTQNITAAPGMSERDVAAHSARQFKEMFDQQLRGAYPDVAYAR